MLYEDFPYGCFLCFPLPGDMFWVMASVAVLAKKGYILGGQCMVIFRPGIKLCIKLRTLKFDEAHLLFFCRSLHDICMIPVTYDCLKPALVFNWCHASLWSIVDLAVTCTINCMNEAISFVQYVTMGNTDGRKINNL